MNKTIEYKRTGFEFKNLVVLSSLALIMSLIFFSLGYISSFIIGYVIACMSLAFGIIIFGYYLFIKVTRRMGTWGVVVGDYGIEVWKPHTLPGQTVCFPWSDIVEVKTRKFAPPESGAIDDSHVLLLNNGKELGLPQEVACDENFLQAFRRGNGPQRQRNTPT